MASRDDRMRENEEVFRTANERLRAHVEGEVSPERPVPFLCECMDELCMKRIDMTLGDYRQVRASDDTFAVAPGHAAPRGEVVVEEQDAFHVVRKEAA
ncbi:MAG: hypothetical protein ACRDOP_01385 [Gaiellaceae bacterium]